MQVRGRGQDWKAQIAARSIQCSVTSNASENLGETMVEVHVGMRWGMLVNGIRDQAIQFAGRMETLAGSGTHSGSKRGSRAWRRNDSR